MSVHSSAVRCAKRLGLAAPAPPLDLALRFNTERSASIGNEPLVQQLALLMKLEEAAGGGSSQGDQPASEGRSSINHTALNYARAAAVVGARRQPSAAATAPHAGSEQLI